MRDKKSQLYLYREKFEASRIYIPGRVFLILLWLMGFTLVLTILNAWLHYPEKYNFFLEPISRLGGLESSDEGLPNDISAGIFATGFQICGVICLLLFLCALFYTPKKENPLIPLTKREKMGQRIFGLYCFAMGWGAMFIGAPYDHDCGFVKFLHITGVVLLLGGFYVFNIKAQSHKVDRKLKAVSIQKNRRKVTRGEKILMIIIGLCVIGYLIATLFNKWLCQGTIIFQALDATFQKLSLITSLIALFMLDYDDMVFPKNVSLFKRFRRK